MPGRIKKIYHQGIYHVFNKTINDFPVFNFEYNCQLFINTSKYYRSNKANTPLSMISRLSEEHKDTLLRLIEIKKYFKIDLLAYTLMPNHYHFLINQIYDNSLSKYIGDVINSFTRHLNQKKDRKGPIFLTKFKAVPVANDESLMYVSRYIHLNLYVAKIITRFDELINYPWSSFQQYVTGREGICNTKPVMSLFDYDNKKYLKFVKNHADYKRSLGQLKYTRNWQ